MVSPNILFLGSEPPSLSAAGSILFRRLFSNWDKKRIKVVTHQLPSSESGRLECEHASYRLPLDFLARTRFWKWRNVARVMGGGSVASLSAIESAVGSFNPDLIVTLMQDSWSYDQAARYAKKIRKPLVGFVHDLPSGFETIPAMLRSQQKARDRKFLNSCDCVISVSEGMRDYFKREFGIDSEVLLPPRSSEHFAEGTEHCLRLKNADRLTLGYAGGLHYGYGQQLEKMLPLLRKNGVFVEAWGAVPSAGLQSLNDASDVFRFHGRLKPVEAWKEIQSRCDAVLLPYLNPAGEHQLQYETHFPSKLGDMLKLGIPILATGHADASGIKWLSKNQNVAVVVKDTRADSLTDALNLLQDKGTRCSLVRNAIRCGEEFEIGNAIENMRRIFAAVGNVNA